MSELRFRSNDSTALWTPGTTEQSALAFGYELSLDTGTTVQSSRTTDTEVQLLLLEEGKTYILDVWEECDGHWESDHSYLYIEGTNSSEQFLSKTGVPCRDLGQCEIPRVLPFLIGLKHMGKITNDKKKSAKYET